MDISTDTLIDLALNIAGFLTAGGLLLVIYSAFNRKNHDSRAGYEDCPQVTGDQHQLPAASARTGRGIEFISLQETGIGPEESKGDELSGRSGRAAVIKMARELLSAGSTHNDVKAVLPISDAELALLNFDRK